MIEVDANKVGADVEFFFEDEEGTVVSADMFLPAKRDGLILHVGKVVDKVPDGYDLPQALLHFDGIQGELTIAPEYCRSWSLDYMRDGLRHAHLLAKDNGLSLSIRTCVPTPKEVLADASDEAVRFGCDPDYNAWNAGMPNSKAHINPKTHYNRYAGCHVHVSTPFAKDKEKTLEAVMLTDIFLGVPLVLLESKDEAVAKRRAVFGGAGCFRYTSYGFEYRTPSANMLSHPFLYLWAWEMARFATAVVNADLFPQVAEALQGNAEAVINAINHNDPKLALWVMERVWPMVQDSHSKRHAQAFLNILTIKEEFGIDRLVDNWQLDFPHHSHHASFRNVGPEYEDWKLDTHYSTIGNVKVGDLDVHTF